MRPGGRFLHRLALALGKSLAEVEALSGHELDRWKAYHALEPLPDPHWIGAQIASVIATVMGGKGKRYGVEDFLPRVATRKQRPRQSPDEMMAALRAATDRRR
jgi:hypothetical protein